MADDLADRIARAERRGDQHSGVIETLLEEQERLREQVEALSQGLLTLANGHKLPAELLARAFGTSPD